jgi:Leucine-rich repeat (LRR) protein
MFYGQQDELPCKLRVTGSPMRLTSSSIFDVNKNINGVEPFTDCDYANFAWTEMGGSPPLNTTTATSCCDSVTICDESGIVTIWWADKNLNGPISSQLQNLSSLAVVNLAYNRLTGDFPSWLVSKTLVQRVILSSNSITGSIPLGFGLHPTFIELSVDYNQMSGALPYDIFQNPGVNFLQLNNNQFTGFIPPFINTNLLVWVFLQNNLLSGELPSLDGLAGSCERFDVSNNQLSGAFPPSLSSLTHLISFYAASNQFNGTIPDLSSLTNLQNIILSNNPLNYDFPTALSTMTSLQTL